jgi:hypothetical protein
MTLLRAKADVRIRNEKGKTPQQEAMEGGNRAIAEDIVEYANGKIIFLKMNCKISCHVIQNVKEKTYSLFYLFTRNDVYDDVRWPFIFRK